MIATPATEPTTAPTMTPVLEDFDAGTGDGELVCGVKAEVCEGPADVDELYVLPA